MVVKSPSLNFNYPLQFEVVNFGFWTKLAHTSIWKGVQAFANVAITWMCALIINKYNLPLIHPAQNFTPLDVCA